MRIIRLAAVAAVLILAPLTACSDASEPLRAAPSAPAQSKTDSTAVSDTTTFSTTDSGGTIGGGGK